MVKSTWMKNSGNEVEESHLEILIKRDKKVLAGDGIFEDWEIAKMKIRELVGAKNPPD